MLNEREDQASGLRRLFRRAPPTVVAMYTCGRAPRRLAARTLLELSRRSPRVLVLDEGRGDAALLAEFTGESRGDLIHLIDGTTRIGSLVSELAPDLGHLAVAGAAMALPLLDDDRREHLITGLHDVQKHCSLMVVHGAADSEVRPSPFVLASPSHLLVVEASASGVTDAFATIRRLAAAGAGDLAVAVAAARDRAEAVDLFRQLDALARRRVGLPLRLIGELGRDDLALRLLEQSPPRREREASAAFLRRLSAWTRGEHLLGRQQA
ncbi:MAG: flagellar FleN [Zoogloeaceae bacterium]|nr:flagellar FleN [Rhodocyclaceae bacterium]MCP5237853.1 flagellar FleN [Zoogloeaceae bacterium]